MSREAIILAGGLGTRLQGIVSDRPKPMALVNNKPFLFYLLNYLSKNNFSHIILAVGYKYETIQEYFGNSSFGMEISYAVEDEPLGTGGAIMNALKCAKNSHTFILNGDTYFPVSFEKIEMKSGEDSNLVLALRPIDNVARYGTVQMNEKGRITGFTEKKGIAENGLINGGVYLMNNNSFTTLEFPENFSFENDYLNKFTSIHNFSGIVFNNYFIDIGIPETFEQAQTDFFTFDI